MIESPLGAPYQGDTSTPVFSWKKSAYHARTIVRILLGVYEPHVLCIAPPVNVAHNVSFLADNREVAVKGDIQCDDMGVWIQNGTPKIGCRVKKQADGAITSVTPEEKMCIFDADPDMYILTRRYYVHSTDKDVRKIISTLEGV